MTLFSENFLHSLFFFFFYCARLKQNTHRTSIGEKGGRAKERSGAEERRRKNVKSRNENYEKINYDGGNASAAPFKLEFRLIQATQRLERKSQVLEFR